MSPRTAEQLEEIREERRASLIAAALDLFARRGYGSTSVRMIAEHAGVAQGLLYNYFASKEDLLRAIFERSMAQVRESFAAADERSSPADRLASVIRSSFGRVRRDPEFWRLSYSLRYQPETAERLGTSVHAGSTMIQGEITRLLRETGVEKPENEAFLLFALIDGVAQHYVLDPEHYPLERVVAAIVERYGETKSAEHT